MSMSVRLDSCRAQCSASRSHTIKPSGLWNYHLSKIRTARLSASVRLQAESGQRWSAADVWQHWNFDKDGQLAQAPLVAEGRTAFIFSSRLCSKSLKFSLSLNTQQHDSCSAFYCIPEKKSAENRMPNSCSCLFVAEWKGTTAFDATCGLNIRNVRSAVKLRVHPDWGQAVFFPLKDGGRYSGVRHGEWKSPQHGPSENTRHRAHDINS